MNEPGMINQQPTRRSWVGFVLIIIGVIMLLNRFMPADWFDWGLFWAILILAMGLILFFKPKQ